MKICFRNPWMLATAGMDKVAKIWDVRMLHEKDVPEPMHVLHHDKALNSVRFRYVL